jgi:hypothetical protein
MIAAAAVVPYPPLLVEGLGRDDSPELDRLRSACRRAVAATLREADALLLVGGGPSWGLAAPGASASFAPYGAAVEVALPAGDRRGWLDLHRLAGALPASLPLPAPGPLEELPLSLMVAAWLLAEAAPAETMAGLAAFAVPDSLDGAQAAALGLALSVAAGAGRTVGLLAMGDLSARRTTKAPASFHPGASAFDQQVGQALRDGAPERLLDLDPALAATLSVAGRVPLQVLAGALQQALAVRGEVLYEAAPYGVGYLVAVLRPS